ncbi:MAG: hypothetical protein WCO98_04835 [bacterium]
MKLKLVLISRIVKKYSHRMEQGGSPANPGNKKKDWQFLMLLIKILPIVPGSHPVPNGD